MQNNHSEATLPLSALDRKILAELDKNCRVSMGELSSTVNESRQVVEYRIRSLVRDGVILSFNTSFNPHKFGLRIYKIYLKIRNIPEDRARLLQKIKSSRLVWWVSECSGTWDIIFAVFSKTDYEVFRIKNELLSEFNKIIVAGYGDALVQVDQYSKMYFTNEVQPSTPFAGEIVNNELDTLEYKILEEFVNNGRIKMTELAKRVRSTPTIVRARVRKLEQLGIIIQYRIGVDISKLGFQLYKTIITVDRYSSEDERAFLNYMSTIPYVHYVSRNVWNLELELVAPNYQVYNTVVENLKQHFPYLIRTVDSVLMLTDEWTPGFANLLRSQKRSTSLRQKRV